MIEDSLWTPQRANDIDPTMIELFQFISYLKLVGCTLKASRGWSISNPNKLFVHIVIFMFICSCWCSHVHVHMFMFTCSCSYVHVHMFMFICSCLCSYVHVYLFMFVLMFICSYSRRCSYFHMFICFQFIMYLLYGILLSLEWTRIIPSKAAISWKNTYIYYYYLKRTD